MILADTSVWIDHFRSSRPEMRRVLARDKIAMHPFVAAELALGSLRDRANTLAFLDWLPQTRVAQLNEIRQMIELRALYSKGIGFVDAHLIASCLLTPGMQLWTRDGALEKAAKALGVLYYPA
ncbi:MAG: PIN domain-containing protein [Terracidiphilus sp.]|jgi:predicted nucleic acid-binding protein